MHSAFFAVGATTVTPAIYAQDDAKAKEEATAIQDVQATSQSSKRAEKF